MKLFAVSNGNTYEIVTEIDANGRKRGRIVSAQQIESPCDVATVSPDGTKIVASINSIDTTANGAC